MDIALNLLDPKSIIQFGGLIAVLVILFAETGLLIGFFLPGDSLLFIAGVAASSTATQLFGTQLSLAGLLIGGPLCAIAGAQLGHALGAKVGPRMFSREQSRLFKREYVQKAEYYFEKFGPAKAVVLARFIPIVRTFLNPVAGVLEMKARYFFVWNVIGGILWVDGLVIVGYLLGGSLASQIEHYLLPAVGLIILLSLTPIFVEIYRERRAKRRAAQEQPPKVLA